MTTLLLNIQKSIFAFAVLLIASTLNNLMHAQTSPQTYTTPGPHTFTVPAGVTSINIECWGGGGKGGGRTTSGVGGGGGGGAFARTNALAVTPGDIIYIQVGAGANTSSPGGISWARKIVNAQPTSTLEGALANGGNSVPDNTAAGALGGVGGIGSITYNGGTGGTGVSSNAGGGGGSAGISENGLNGSAPDGAGAQTGGGAGGNGHSGAGSSNGFPGELPGGGGGGCRRTSGTWTGSNGANGQVRITWSAAAIPTITVNPTSLSGFTYVFGNGPSTQQSFVISGSDLTNNISIIPPANYEISTISGGGFTATDPIVLTQSGGIVNNTNIFVRLKAGLSTGNYNSEDITATSTGATTRTVTCSGSVTAPTPTVTTGTITGSPFCVTSSAGASVTVPFTSAFINPGNTFTAQLSNASGSFASPIPIGTLVNNNDASVNISATIPAGTASGTGYRIRVIASDPVTTGSANTVNLTITNAPLNVTGAGATGGNNQATVNWANPSNCFDEILVIASNSSISGTPSGSPTANAIFGSGTPLLGGFVVYSGAGTNVTVTGLTNGTTNFFRVFTRFGTIWSTGVQVSTTPADPGAILLGWDLANVNGQDATATAGFFANGVSESGNGILTRNGLGNGSSSANILGQYSVNQINLSSSLISTDYISFSVSPQSGYRLNINSFDFVFERTTNGAQKVQLRSSLDGFTNALGGGEVNVTSASPMLISIPIAGHTNLTGNIEFRLYIYNRNSSGGLNTTNSHLKNSSTLAPVGDYDVVLKGTAVINTWTGSVSSVWNNAANWSEGVVPGASNGALIPQITNPLHFNPIIAGLTPTVGTLVVGPNGNLTIASDGALTVNTRITNNGLLTVNSGGALVQPAGSTIEGTGTYTIRRQIPGSNNGFRFLGSPIKNLAVNAVGGITANGPDGGQVIPLAGCNISNVAAGSPFGNILELRENPTAVLEGCAQSLWHVKSAGLLENGRGYAMRASGGQTINFSGNEVNNGNVVLTGLTRQSGNVIDHISGNVSRGWHLVSNPYPSPITLVGNTHLVPQGFDGQIQLYNSATGSWEAPQPPSAAVTIAVGQAFQIRKTNEGGSSTLTLNNGMRVSTTGVNYFNTNEWFDYKFEMKVNGNGNQDNTIIFFHPEASDSFDPTMDVNKMTGPVDMPMLFTMANDERMAYNGLPLLETPRIIPMSFYPGTAGNYSLSIEHLETLPSTMMIYLEDKKTGVWTNLRTSANYMFTASLSDDIQRFALHLEPPVSIITESETCATNDGKIIINNPSNLIWNVIVNGEVVNAGSDLTIIGGLIAGNYELTVSSGVYSANESVQIETTTFEATEIEVLQQHGDGVELIQAEVINPIEEALYVWEISGLNVGSGPSVEFAITQAGSYDLFLKTHWNNCTSLTSHNLFANPIVNSVKPSEQISDLSVFPNPGNGIFNIVWNNSAGKNFEQVVITDLAGRVLKQFDIADYSKGNQIQVDLSKYQNGTYFVHLTSSGQVHTIKVGLVK